MAGETRSKILHLLDVLSVEAAEGRKER